MRFKNQWDRQLLIVLAASAFLMAFSLWSDNNAAMAQIPAFLPDKDTVPETRAMPIDGTWRVSTLGGKRIRIEQGRAYSIDPWVFMFVLQVQPNMVVSKDYERIEAGKYTMFDLPLQGPGTLQLKADGSIDVSVKGAWGPVTFVLQQDEIDDPASLEEEIAAMTGSGGSETPGDSEPGEREPTPEDREPAPETRDPLENCKKLGIDTKTGEIVCKD